MKKSFSYLMILLATIISLAGCSAKMAQGPIFQNLKEKDKSKAIVYFYRGDDVYGIKTLENIPVICNDNKIGYLYRGGYFIYKTEPGIYKFYTEVKGAILDTTLEIELKGNEIYFIKSVFRSILLSNTNSLIIVPEDEALMELKNYRYQTK